MGSKTLLGVGKSNLSSVVYDTMAQAYFNQVVINGGAALSSDWKALLNTWFIAAQANGYFTEFDALYITFNENEVAARTSVVNPTTAAYLTYGVSTVQFIQFYGFVPDGTNYIKTSFIPSISGVKFTLNSALMGCGLVQNVTGSTADIGVGDGTKLLFIESTVGGTCYMDVNDNGPNNTRANSGVLDADYFAVRTSSTGLTSYKDNSAVTRSTTSTGLPTKEVYVGALNDNGTANYLKNVGITWFGFASKNVTVATFRTDMTALQYAPDRSMILIIDQSNSTGLAAGHVYANLPSQYKPIQRKVTSIFDGSSSAQYRAGFNSLHGDTSGTSFEWTASCMHKLMYTYNKRPMCVNMSVGNTSLASPPIGTNTWDYTYPGNLLTSSMALYFANALVYCARNKSIVCVLGLVENDASSLAAANAHYANKVALIAKLRSSVGSGGTGISDLKIILLKPKIELDPATHPYTSIVIAAIDLIAANDSNCIIYDEAPLTYQGDLIHLTDASAVTMGLSIADLVAPYCTY